MPYPNERTYAEMGWYEIAKGIGQILAVALVAWYAAVAFVPYL